MTKVHPYSIWLDFRSFISPRWYWHRRYDDECATSSTTTMIYAIMLYWLVFIFHLFSFSFYTSFRQQSRSGWINYGPVSLTTNHPQAQMPDYIQLIILLERIYDASDFDGAWPKVNDSHRPFHSIFRCESRKSNPLKAISWQNRIQFIHFQPHGWMNPVDGRCENLKIESKREWEREGEGRRSETPNQI